LAAFGVLSLVGINVSRNLLTILIRDFIALIKYEIVSHYEAKGTHMAQLPILIIGATGKTGARVHRLLVERGMATRPVARSAAIPFDWTRPETWGPALEGTSKAYVTYQPDLAVDGAPETIAAFARIARNTGLEQIVLLSGRGEPGAERAEAALQASGVAWTILRSSWFCQNFSEGHMVEGILAGHLELPAGPVREPFIDIDDIADIAVAALTDVRHLNKLYVVTGPRALTFADAVAEIASAANRPIQYAQVSPDAFSSTLRAGQVPADTIALMHDLFTVVLDGRNEQIEDGVMQALGRPARDFSDYARKAAASGVWDT
jgi:uncharacterized protein YbjT (DUF2867 family)